MLNENLVFKPGHPCLQFEMASNVSLDCNGHTIEDKSGEANEETPIYLSNVAGFLVVNCRFVNPNPGSGAHSAEIYTSTSGVFENDIFEAGAGSALIVPVESMGVAFNRDVFTNVIETQVHSSHMYFGFNDMTVPTQWDVYSVYMVEGGSQNTFDANHIDGDGAVHAREDNNPAYGTDDNITAIESATEDNIVNNQFANTYDCGVETVGPTVRNTIEDNGFDTNWSAAACDFYNTDWLDNTVSNNHAAYSGSMVLLAGNGTQYPENYFYGNRFEGNTVRADQPDQWGDSFGAFSWSHHNREHLGDNVVANNEFGKTTTTPQIERLTPGLVSAHSGNRCPPPSAIELEQIENIGCTEPTEVPPAAEPQIIGVYPAKVPLAGGLPIAIEGANFEGAAKPKVLIGGSEATNVTVPEDGRIIATVPAHPAGTVDVEVEVSGHRTVPVAGTGALASTDQLTYAKIATVSSVSPFGGAGAGGTAVTVTGAGFDEASSVSFGSFGESRCEGEHPAEPCFTVTSETSIAADSPSASAANVQHGFVNVRVATPAGLSPLTEGIGLELGSAANDGFSYTNVTGVTPDVGPLAGRTTVTLSGEHFAQVTAVKFGAVEAASFEVPDTARGDNGEELVATAPASEAPGTFDVTVVFRGGATVKVPADQYTYYTAPSVSALAPKVGSQYGGTHVRITGTHFEHVERVTFGGVEAQQFEVASKTELIAIAPAGAPHSHVEVGVQTPGGTALSGSADQFGYNPGRVSVSALTPASGPESGGASVKVTGEDLEEVESVMFGLTPAQSFAITGPESITAVAPPGVGTVNVRVTGSAGASSVTSADQFSYTANPSAAPTISNVQADAGPEAGGVQVIVSGANLVGVTAVNFGSRPAVSFKVLSATALSAVVPEGTGTVDVTASNAKGTSAAVPADQFSYRRAGAPLGWGSNNSGQLGDNSTERSTGPIVAFGGGETSVLAGGANFTLALMNGGNVEAYGANVNGQLGDESTEPSRVPVPVKGLPGEPVVAVAAGAEHALALLRNGHVWAWGDNESGQLGNGTTLGATKPVEVSGLSEVAAIAAGDAFSLALKRNGSVWAWGANALGQLGDGATTSSATPVELPGIDEVVAIAAHGSSAPGGNHTLALLRNGSVAAWGENAEGDLGNGSQSGPESCASTACSKHPVAVTELTEVTAVAVGAEHSLALQATGTVKAWGSGFFGELGRGSILGSATPVGVNSLTEGSAIAAGKFHSLALLKGGRLDAWGENRNGQLGDNTSSGPERCIGVFACAEQPTEVQGIGPAASIGAGEYSSLAAGLLLPLVTGIEPSSGPVAGGTSVVIRGTGFTAPSAVRFGAKGASSFRLDTETEITAVAPSGTGTVDVTVQTAAGTSATGSADQYTYIAPPAPPVLIANSSVKPVIATCVAETEVCLATEKHAVRSAYEPTVSWGPLTLHAEGFGPAGVHCTSTSTGRLWNEYEGAETENPLRAYGVINAWGTADCTAPELLEPIEHESGTGPITVFVTGEKSLQERTREAEACAVSERGVYKRLAECPPTERTHAQLVSEVNRQNTSLPWKAEMIRGRTSAGESVVLQRIGIASYGECGPGEGEASATDPVRCRAREGNSRCFPASPTLTEIPAGCIELNLVIPQIPIEIPLYGSVEETWRNGVGTGVDPSRLELEQGWSGALLSPREPENNASFGADAKVLGEESQALLTMR